MTIQTAIKVNYIEDESKAFRYGMKCAKFKATSTNGIAKPKIDVFKREESLPYWFYPITSTVRAKVFAKDIDDLIASLEPGYRTITTSCLCGLCDSVIHTMQLMPKKVSKSLLK